MILCIAGSFFIITLQAQVKVPSTPPPIPAVSPQSDSTTEIQIIFAESLRNITLADGTQLQTLAGNAAVMQGNTKLTGDSIVLNSLTSCLLYTSRCV